MREGIQVVVVREEEAGDVLILEHENLLGFLVDLVDVVLIEEEKVFIDQLPAVRHTLVLEFVVPVFDADARVELVLEEGVSLGGVLLAVVNEALAKPDALRLQLRRPFLLLALLELVLVVASLLYHGLFFP